MGKPILERLKIAEQRIRDLYKRPTTSGGGDTNPTNPSFTSAEVATGGTWIDGKPIYRKVIPFTVPGIGDSPSSLGVVHNLNIDKYLRADALASIPVDVVTQDCSWFFPINSANNLALAMTGIVMLNRDNITFEEVQCAITDTNDFLMILEYTKV